MVEYPAVAHGEQAEDLINERDDRFDDRRGCARRKSICCMAKQINFCLLRVWVYEGDCDSSRSNDVLCSV